MHHSHEGQSSKVREWNTGGETLHLRSTFHTHGTEKLMRVTVIRKMSLVKRNQTSRKEMRILKKPQKMTRPTAKQLHGLI